MEGAWQRAKRDARRWVSTRREVAGFLVPAVIAVVFLNQTRDNEAWIDALIVLGAGVAGALLTPLFVLCGSLLTARRRILHESVEALLSRVEALEHTPEPAAAPAKRQRDPKAEALLRELKPMVDELPFLLKRMSQHRGYDNAQFKRDSERWIKRVSDVLINEPLYSPQFLSDPPGQTSDNIDRWASIELEHRAEMFMIILKSLRQR